MLDIKFNICIASNSKVHSQQKYVLVYVCHNEREHFSSWLPNGNNPNVHSKWKNCPTWIQEKTIHQYKCHITAKYNNKDVTYKYNIQVKEAGPNRVHRTVNDPFIPVQNQARLVGDVKSQDGGYL